MFAVGIPMDEATAAALHDYGERLLVAFAHHDMGRYLNFTEQPTDTRAAYSEAAYAGWPDEYAPANPFVPERNVPAADCQPCWQDWSIRAGGSYDLPRGSSARHARERLAKPESSRDPDPEHADPIAELENEVGTGQHVGVAAAHVQDRNLFAPG